MERHEKIAQNLERLIATSGTNPSSLARSVGLSHTAARDIISGKSRNPTDRTLYLLAKGLGVHITELTGEPAPKFESHEADGVITGEVDRLTFGRQTQDTIAHLAPKVENPHLYVAIKDAPGFGVKVGDFLIVDPALVPQKTGDLVIISKPILRGQVSHCAVAKYYPPYLVPADPLMFGVAVDQRGPNAVPVEGIVVGRFTLDPGTTAAILNRSSDLD